MAVLRAERNGLRELAARADRAARTFTARRCALEAYRLLQNDRRLLTAQPGWCRVDASHYRFSFGDRGAVITMPAQPTAQQLASLVVRTEIKVLLGDRDLELVSSFQALAAGELQRLFAAPSPR
jgi:hypothetical protein